MTKNIQPRYRASNERDDTPELHLQLREDPTAADEWAEPAAIMIARGYKLALVTEPASGRDGRLPLTDYGPWLDRFDEAMRIEGVPGWTEHLANEHRMYVERIIDYARGTRRGYRWPSALGERRPGRGDPFVTLSLAVRHSVDALLSVNRAAGELRQTPEAKNSAAVRARLDSLAAASTGALCDFTLATASPDDLLSVHCKALESGLAIAKKHGEVGAVRALEADLKEARDQLAQQQQSPF